MPQIRAETVTKKISKWFYFAILKYRFEVNTKN